MKAPFPFFGGKRRVASEVWAALGDVQSYVEPFAGSLAVLLERPDWHHQPRTETVNDADAYLSNLWRALAADPDEVARLADWPVNECDLLARHLWLVNEGKRRIERMESDPDFYDLKVAAWWVWGINAWIGSGWCAGTGPWRVKDGRVVEGEGGGVNRKLPHLGDAGRGVNRKLPHLGSQHRGINDDGPDPFTFGGGSDFGRYRWDRSLCRDGEPPMYGYLRALAARLRRVRVCCGDWSRVVTDGALAYGDTVGILLDPPYLGDVRSRDLYRVDDHDIAHAVREWTIEHGDNPRYRIALCGYEDEHAGKMPETWRVHAYSASRAYGTSGNADTANNANRHKERIWFSQECFNAQPMLMHLKVQA